MFRSHRTILRNTSSHWIITPLRYYLGEKCFQRKAYRKLKHLRFSSASLQVRIQLIRTQRKRHMCCAMRSWPLPAPCVPSSPSGGQTWIYPYLGHTYLWVILTTLLWIRNRLLINRPLLVLCEYRTKTNSVRSVTSVSRELSFSIWVLISWKILPMQIYLMIWVL
jgi:hypothetical protein